MHKLKLKFITFLERIMLEIINAVKPYQLDNINTIPKSLAFYKNVLKTISKKGCIEFSYNNIYPVRWSSIKQSFVIDFRTSKTRDVEGICSNSISRYYKTSTEDFATMTTLLKDINLKCTEELWEKINIKKNQNRFLCFTKNDKGIFIFLGLYIFNQTKGRQGNYCHEGNKSRLIDNSEETLNKICKLLDSKSIILPRRYKIEHYLNEYERFKSRIINYKDKYTNEKEELEINLYDCMNTVFKKDYKITLCKDLVVNKNIYNKEKDIQNIIPYIINKLFLEFIKDIVHLEEGIMVYDKLLAKNIIIKKFHKTNCNKPEKPIEYDNVFIFPGVF